MQNLFSKFANDESGATAIEYGLIAALIAIALIAGATTLGQSVSDKFEDVSTTLNTVDESAPVAKNGAD